MKKIGNEQDLRHMDSRSVLAYSKLDAGLTNAEMATGLGVGEETVARYLREPRPDEHPYDLGIGRVRLWCQKAGNYFVAQWIAQQCGGVFVLTDARRPEDMSISRRVEKINRETADVVSELIRGMSTDALACRDRVLRELIDLKLAVEEAISVIESTNMVK